jgi:hypothetical protein
VKGKTRSSATLSTNNPTRNDPGLNPGLRGQRPATNRLSHGTATELVLISKRIRLVLRLLVGWSVGAFRPSLRVRALTNHKLCVFCVTGCWLVPQKRRRLSLASEEAVPYIGVTSAGTMPAKKFHSTSQVSRKY